MAKRSLSPASAKMTASSADWPQDDVRSELTPETGRHESLSPPPGGRMPSDSELRSGHRKRLRERFLAAPSELPEYELLELMLGYVYLRRDNKMLAKRLILRFGSIEGLLSASNEERGLVEGCGESVDSLCALIREIIARCEQSAVQQKQTVGLMDIMAMGSQRLRRCHDEEVWAALLDNQSRLITYTVIRRGSVDRVALEPLEIVELMLRWKANSVVLMHNHPGGSFRPSIADRELTARIETALRHLGLFLHDHLIITADKCYSCKLDRAFDAPESCKTSISGPCPN